MARSKNKGAALQSQAQKPQTSNPGNTYGRAGGRTSAKKSLMDNAIQVTGDVASVVNGVHAVAKAAKAASNIGRAVKAVVNSPEFYHKDGIGDHINLNPAPSYPTLRNTFPQVFNGVIVPHYEIEVIVGRGSGYGRTLAANSIMTRLRRDVRSNVNYSSVDVINYIDYAVFCRYLWNFALRNLRASITYRASDLAGQEMLLRYIDDHGAVEEGTINWMREWDYATYMTKVPALRSTLNTFAAWCQTRFPFTCSAFDAADSDFACLFLDSARDDAPAFYFKPVGIWAWAANPDASDSLSESARVELTDVSIDALIDKMNEVMTVVNNSTIAQDVRYDNIMGDMNRLGLPTAKWDVTTVANEPLQYVYDPIRCAQVRNASCMPHNMWTPGTADLHKMKWSTYSAANSTYQSALTADFGRVYFGVPSAVDGTTYVLERSAHDSIVSISAGGASGTGDKTIISIPDDINIAALNTPGMPKELARYTGVFQTEYKSNGIAITFGDLREVIANITAVQSPTQKSTLYPAQWINAFYANPSATSPSELINGLNATVNGAALHAWLHCFPLSVNSMAFPTSSAGGTLSARGWLNVNIDTPTIIYASTLSEMNNTSAYSLFSPVGIAIGK